MIEHHYQIFHCLEAVHNGSGEEIGIADRAVIRDPTTRWPCFIGDSLKGSFKAQLRRGDAMIESTPAFQAAFGKGETDGFQGSLSFTKAGLLALPVPSLAGTFGWVTCTLALARFAMHCDLAGLDSKPITSLLNVISDPSDGTCHVTSHGTDDASMNPLQIEPGSTLRHLANLVVEAEVSSDLREASAFLSAVIFPDDSNTYWRTFFTDRLVVLSQSQFTRLAYRGLPVHANIQILDTGVTQAGSLRYTETVPAESILTGLLTTQKPYHPSVNSDDTLKVYSKLFNGEPRRAIGFVGADRTKGRGMVRVIWPNAGRSTIAGGTHAR